MAYILDACSAVAFLRDETGAEIVERALQDNSALSYIHAVNLAEVYYAVARNEDEDAAEEAIRTLVDDGAVRVYPDFDEGFCKEVGRLRAYVRTMGWRISLADCFCLATARRLGGQLLTSDRSEFQRVVPLGWCSIGFIR